MEPKCYLTLCTSNSYALGASVLASSLRQLDSRFPIYCLTSLESLSHASILLLLHSIDGLILVDKLATHKDNMEILTSADVNRPELSHALTKLHCWKLDGQTKLPFIPSPYAKFSNLNQTICQGLQVARHLAFESGEERTLKADTIT
jgi:hypothetical protein